MKGTCSRPVYCYVIPVATDFRMRPLIKREFSVQLQLQPPSVAELMYEGRLAEFHLFTSLNSCMRDVRWPKVLTS
jgi:hypothetical protein